MPGMERFPGTLLELSGSGFPLLLAIWEWQTEKPLSFKTWASTAMVTEKQDGPLGPWDSRSDLFGSGHRSSSKRKSIFVYHVLLGSLVQVTCWTWRPGYPCLESPISVISGASVRSRCLLQRNTSGGVASVTSSCTGQLVRTVVMLAVCTTVFMLLMCKCKTFF